MTSNETVAAPTRRDWIALAVLSIGLGLIVHPGPSSEHAQLRLQGGAGPLGDQTESAVEALASGFADATRWALVVAAAFLVLGFGGAVRLRRAARSGPD